MTRHSLGKILIASSILLVVFTLGRGYFYYSPDKANTQETESESRTRASVIEGNVVATTENGNPPRSGPPAENDDNKPAPGANNGSVLPSRLSIPEIGVNAHVERLGLTANGNMASPDGFSNVSWYKHGTIPGKVGSAVMAGHDNGIYTPGVFRNLNNLNIGDDVYVTSGTGEKLHFKVVDKQIYPYDEAPLERIFTRSDKARLNLITCTGEWIPSLKMSDHRIVVYTELVSG